MEQNYNQGLSNKACDMMYANQLTSYNVEMMCKKCQKKRQATDSTMSKLRLKLKDLSQTVSKLKEDRSKPAQLSLREEIESADAEAEMENEKEEETTLSGTH